MIVQPPEDFVYADICTSYQHVTDLEAALSYSRGVICVKGSQNAWHPPGAQALLTSIRTHPLTRAVLVYDFLTGSMSGAQQFDELYGFFPPDPRVAVWYMADLERNPTGPSYTEPIAADWCRRGEQRAPGRIASYRNSWTRPMPVEDFLIIASYGRRGDPPGNEDAWQYTDGTWANRSWADDGGLLPSGVPGISPGTHDMNLLENPAKLLAGVQEGDDVDQPTFERMMGVALGVNPDKLKSLGQFLAGEKHHEDAGKRSGINPANRERVQGWDFAEKAVGGGQP